jgi:hypothetical protein
MLLIRLRREGMMTSKVGLRRDVVGGLPDDFPKRGGGDLHSNGAILLRIGMFTRSFFCAFTSFYQ